MHTNALLESAPEPPVKDGLAERVAALVEEHCARWRDTRCDSPVLGPPVPRSTQRVNARAAVELIDRVAGDVERWPGKGQGRRLWRERLRSAIREFGEERLGWPAGYRNLLVSDEFYTASVAFARRAREFDPSVRLEDVGQALRNVWIANSLQLLLDLPVELSPSIFAYSMLYPYTDNYLDASDVAATAKHRFNGRLSRRLRGERLAPQGERERDIFRLVQMIEANYPRVAFPDVHASLLAIQGGQIRSLRQQASREGLYTSDLLAISVEKGGSSVLADGYLVAGEPQPEEVDFFFGYGVFLQLLDDLQDARADREAGHRTLFSTAADRVPLDRLTSQLSNYMRGVLERTPLFEAPEYADRLDLIRRNCTFLLVGAVAENEELFSAPFRQKLEERWPFSLAATRRLRRLTTKRFEKVGRRLRAQGEGEDWGELLG